MEMDLDSKDVRILLQRIRTVRAYLTDAEIAKMILEENPKLRPEAVFLLIRCALVLDGPIGDSFSE